MRRGSSAVPITEVGRVWGTSASRAPRVTTISTPSARAACEDRGAERPPLQLGLVADQEHEVVAGLGHRRRPQLDVGPLDLAAPAADVVHGGTDGGEVVELLGVDAGDLLGAEALGEPAHGARRGIAGVVPPLERAHQDGSPQLRAVDPVQVLHGHHATGACPVRTVADDGRERLGRTTLEWRSTGAETAAGIRRLAAPTSGAQARTRPPRPAAATAPPHGSPAGRRGSPAPSAPGRAAARPERSRPPRRCRGTAAAVGGSHAWRHGTWARLPPIDARRSRTVIIC